MKLVIQSKSLILKKTLTFILFYFFIFLSCCVSWSEVQNRRIVAFSSDLRWTSDRPSAVKAACGRTGESLQLFKGFFSKSLFPFLFNIWIDYFVSIHVLLWIKKKKKVFIYWCFSFNIFSLLFYCFFHLLKYFYCELKIITKWESICYKIKALFYLKKHFLSNLQEDV